MSGDAVNGLALTNVSILRLDKLASPVAGIPAAGDPAAGDPVAGIPVAGIPVAGIPVAGIPVAGIPAVSNTAAGNKYFKLRPFLQYARSQHAGRLLSFGGAWSNHLHALAEMGAAAGLQTTGIVRAQAHEPDTPTLLDAAAAGMQLVKVGRAEYARRHDHDYLASLQRRFAPCVIIPEGGATAAAAQSCEDIASMIVQQRPDVRQIVVAVGTGTTLAGIVSGVSRHDLQHRVSVHGVSALKGAFDLDDNVASLLQQSNVLQPAPWVLHHDHHCGGFARVSTPLQEFMLAFEREYRIPLDPVYTAKAVFATGQLLDNGVLDSALPTVVVHSGGLQGRRGYAFLSCSRISAHQTDS